MDDSTTGRSGHGTFLCALALFVAMAAVANPVRETVVGDDYCYIKTARELASTGHYVLDSFCGANIIFPAAGIAALSKIFGFSFTLGRLWSLSFSALGLCAFYRLAQDHGHSREAAALGALVMATSVMYLRISNVFLSDIPLVTLLLLAILLYGEGLRRGDIRRVLAGAVAASLAILTRQFGVQILAGLALAWALDAERRPRARLYVLAIVPPLAAAAFQSSVAAKGLSWGARRAVNLTLQWYAHPSVWLPEAASRAPVIAVFCALMTLPFACVCLAEWRRHRRGEAPFPALLKAACAALLAYGFCYAALVQALGWLVPFRYEHCDVVEQFGVLPQVYLTVVVALAAFSYMLLAARRVAATLASRRTERVILDGSALAAIGMHMVFGFLYDRYLLDLLPWTLLFLLDAFEAAVLRRRRLVIGMCLASAVAVTLWTRGWLAEAECYWRAAEELRLSGIPANRIFGRWTFVAYHRFDEWCAETEPRGSWDLDDFFHRWWPAQRDRCNYNLFEHPAPPRLPGWSVVGETGFADWLFRWHRVFVVKREVPVP